MTDVLNVFAIAKAGGYDRAALFERIQEIAESRREPGQTREQAFAKFITKDPDGAELYALQRSMPGHDIKPETTVAKSRPAASAFDGLVGGLMRLGGVSYSKAVDQALATPEGQALYAKTRRVEKIAAGFTALDLATDDMIEAQRRNLRKADTTSEFDAEVAKVMARNPTMNRSAAIDFTLTTAVGKRLWDAQKAQHQAAVAKAAYASAAGPSSQPGDVSPAATVADAPHVALDENPHLVDWDAIVDGEQARQPGISRSAAITAALQTPKGQRAWAAAKAARPAVAATR